MKKKELSRLKQLENKAKKLYIENSDWDRIVLMLSEKEQKEWERLIKKYQRS